MPTYIVQANYTKDAVKGLLADASNRRAAVAAIIEAAGGSLTELYVTTGSHDLLAIVDAPDTAAVLSNNMAIAASGSASNFQTMQAWTIDDFAGIAQKAGQIAGTYTPPGG